ncbi:hypothetical protein GCK72_019808 [Caenorhabditis remanei]|uniref:SPK domain-containing protein n=1 Tax=Caenorhabditis remanei TaxID=31234 RepID=A0A6A5GFJ3_CAERE|nr:hypothetical protein GCK72_019808 [Caenorhabditis remanei]KAF1753252.1 hypothetical protein GCK72_019808 [Caenorhabditis remanei]
MNSGSDNEEDLCFELMKYVAYRSSRRESYSSPAQLLRRFIEKYRCPLSETALREKLNEHLLKLHERKDVDEETKVRILFALQAPVHPSFLKELHKHAIVRTRDVNKRRIVQYKKTDGSIELSDNERQKYLLQMRNILSYCARISKKVSPNRMPAIEMLRFYEEEYEIVELRENETFEDLVRLLNEEIYEYVHKDKETRIRMLYVMKTEIGEELLEELQRDGIVELDAEQRIKRYETKDGNLKLEVIQRSSEEDERKEEVEEREDANEDTFDSSDRVVTNSDDSESCQRKRKLRNSSSKTNATDHISDESHRVEDDYKQNVLQIPISSSQKANGNSTERQDLLTPKPEEPSDDSDHSGEKEIGGLSTSKGIRKRTDPGDLNPSSSKRIKLENSNNMEQSDNHTIKTENHQSSPMRDNIESEQQWLEDVDALIPEPINDLMQFKDEVEEYPLENFEAVPLIKPEILYETLEEPVDDSTSLKDFLHLLLGVVGTLDTNFSYKSVSKINERLLKLGSRDVSVPINKVLVAMGSCLQIVNPTAKTCVPDSVETMSLGEFILLLQGSIPFIDHPKFDSFREKLNQIMNEGQDKKIPISSICLAITMTVSTVAPMCQL